MSHTPRPRRGVPRTTQPGPQEYAAVPQSPRSGINHSSGSQYNSRPPTRSPSVSSNQQPNLQSGRGAIAAGVATGAIGAGYGPYSVSDYLIFSIYNQPSKRSITQTIPEMLVFTVPLDLVPLLQTSRIRG